MLNSSSFPSTLDLMTSLWTNTNFQVFKKVFESLLFLGKSKRMPLKTKHEMPNVSVIQHNNFLLRICVPALIFTFKETTQVIYYFGYTNKCTCINEYQELNEIVSCRGHSYLKLTSLHSVIFYTITSTIFYFQVYTRSV